jgi:hypothetical protein
MNCIQKESPRDFVRGSIHHFFATEKAWDSRFPATRIDRMHFPRQRIVQTIVCIENLLHPCWCRHISPLDFAADETRCQHEFFLNEKPRNLKRRPRLRVDAIVTPFSWDSSDDLPCSWRLFVPTLQKEGLVVYRSSVGRLQRIIQ